MHTIICIMVAMRVTWHEPKRQATLSMRGLDFADAEMIFAGPTFTFEDEIRIYRRVRQREMSNFYSSATSDERDEYPKITQADLDRATFRVGLKPAPRQNGA